MVHLLCESTIGGECNVCGMIAAVILHEYIHADLFDKLVNPPSSGTFVDTFDFYERFAFQATPAHNTLAWDALRSDNVEAWDLIPEPRQQALIRASNDLKNIASKKCP